MTESVSSSSTYTKPNSVLKRDQLFPSIGLGRSSVVAEGASITALTVRAMVSA
jgi:hypothetical protein